MKLRIDLETGEVEVDGVCVADVTRVHVEIPVRVRFCSGFGAGSGSISRSETLIKEAASGASCTIIKERWKVERYFPERD